MAQDAIFVLLLTKIVRASMDSVVRSLCFLACQDLLGEKLKRFQLSGLFPDYHGLHSLYLQSNNGLCECVQIFRLAGCCSTWPPKPFSVRRLWLLASLLDRNLHDSAGELMRWPLLRIITNYVSEGGCH
jgi:hypothetical protein